MLAPTYNNSVKILQSISPSISVMLGGHQTRALTQEILKDERIPRIDAMIIGEGELRVAKILENLENRKCLPLTYWKDNSGQIGYGVCKGDASKWLVPDINALPFVDRKFLTNDPLHLGCRQRLSGSLFLSGRERASAASDLKDESSAALMGAHLRS